MHLRIIFGALKHMSDCWFRFSVGYFVCFSCFSNPRPVCLFVLWFLLVFLLYFLLFVLNVSTGASDCLDPRNDLLSVEMDAKRYSLSTCI